MNSTINQMKSPTEILSDHSIDILSMDDDFNTHLLTAMERYAEQKVGQYVTEKLQEKLGGKINGFTESLYPNTQTTLDSLAEKAIDACCEYYKEYKKENDHTVCYVRNTETGYTFLFTKGEHFDRLINFIENLNKV